MHLGSAHFLDVAGRWVMQAVQALPASFGSSLRPVSTSNGAGSRAAGSRGPWSSAELATRPVRKGPPKPKENAPDSRKTRTSNHRIPESGKGLRIPKYERQRVKTPLVRLSRVRTQKIEVHRPYIQYTRAVPVGSARVVDRSEGRFGANATRPDHYTT